MTSASAKAASPDKWSDQDEPRLVDTSRAGARPDDGLPDDLDARRRRPARHRAPSLKALNKPIAGKTGTTNDEKDAWFVGYSPDLLCGLYVGYDKPRALGKGMTGGHFAAPIFGEFMKVALADKPPVPFRVPPGIKLIRIDRKSGLRASGEGGSTILEAFKPGTAPPNSYSIIGASGGSVSPESDRAVTTGTGGLY